MGGSDPNEFRAAQSRPEWVAPAHLSVLPACKSLSLGLRIWLFLLCLSLFNSESWFESCAESLAQRLRHLCHSGPRDSACNAGLKKGGLTVDELGAERDFLLGREVTEFRSDHVGGGASLKPLVIANVGQSIVKLLRRAVEKLEVVIVQLAVQLGFPKLAQGEIAEDLLAGIDVW